MSTLMWTLLLLAVMRSVFGRWQYNQLRCNDILSSIFGGGQHESAPAPTANLGALPSSGGTIGAGAGAPPPLPPLAPVSSASNAGLPSASALGIGTKTPAPAGNTLAGLANQ